MFSKVDIAKPKVAHHNGELLEILSGPALKRPIKKVKQAPVSIEWKYENHFMLSPVW